MTADENRLHRLLRELLGEGLPVELRLVGRSMSPFLRDGDLVVLEPRGGRLARRGDVVAFLVEGRELVIHRVVSVAGETLRTRGDALRRADAPVALCEVLGFVVSATRGERRVRLGLGPERVLIAWLSGLLSGLASIGTQR